ncbi:MAG: hypothetical protein canaca05_02480, partial [Anaerolineaceae bacterium]
LSWSASRGTWQQHTNTPHRLPACNQRSLATSCSKQSWILACSNLKSSKQS